MKKFTSTKSVEISLNCDEARKVIGGKEKTISLTLGAIEKYEVSFKSYNNVYMKLKENG